MGVWVLRLGLAIEAVGLQLLVPESLARKQERQGHHCRQQSSKSASGGVDDRFKGSFATSKTRRAYRLLANLSISSQALHPKTSAAGHLRIYRRRPPLGAYLGGGGGGFSGAWDCFLYNPGFFRGPGFR